MRVQLQRPYIGSRVLISQGFKCGAFDSSNIIEIEDLAGGYLKESKVGSNTESE